MCELCNCYADNQRAAAYAPDLAVLDAHLLAISNATFNAIGMGLRLQNAYVPPAVARLRKAQAIAAEVRSRRPEMQVRRIAV